MTDTIKEAFAAAQPRAIDFAQDDYESRKTVFDQAAAAAGYRLAGFRLKRAVFTTKLPPAPVERKPWIPSKEDDA